MATRPSVRTSLNGKRPGVSHAKPPAAADPVDDETDGEHPSTSPADDVPAGPPPVDSLSEMMSGLQGANTARIHVYRIVKNQPPAYVFECDPTTFSLDDLRDKYNGGEFRLYIMKDSRLWRNMRVLVEPKSVFHGPDPVAPSNQVSDLMAMMRESIAQQTAMIRDMLASRPPSPFANMDLPAIITAGAAALTALRPPPAPPPIAQPDMSEKALDMFMRGLEIANTMREGSGSEGGISGMLRDVLRSPIVAEAVRSAMPTAQPQQPRPPQQAQPALPNPSAPVSHAKPAEPTPQPQDDNKVLAYYLGFLVGKAKTGAEPSLYAELVLDNVPDVQLTPMLARGDGLIDYLIEVQPLVAQHRDWFVKLIHEINELLEPEPEGDGTIELTGDAHAVDATANVVPGQPAQ